MKQKKNLKFIALGAGGRLAGMMFAAVFALAFGAGGIWGGVWPLYETLSARAAVDAWVPVQAQVLESQLSSRRSDDSTVYRAEIRYRYLFEGRAYESTRVGLEADARSDNIGDWHSQWVRRAEAAQRNGKTLTAMVNPQAPGEALLDPDIRWPKLIFHLPFALVFTGIGLVAAWVFVALLFRRDTHPAEEERDLSRSLRKSSASKQLGGLWFIALFWCGLCFPIAAVFWLTGAPWVVRLMLLLFVGIGIWLLVQAIRQTRKAWRYSAANLAIDPPNPQAGQRFEVSLSTPAEQGDVFSGSLPPMKMRLAHCRINDAGSGTSERRVESFDALATGLPDMQGHIRWVAHFKLPDDAPTHGARRSGERVDWRLEVLKDDGSLDVSYEVPVEGMAAAAHAPDRFAENLDFRTEHALGGSLAGAGAGAGASGEASLGSSFAPSAADMPPQVSLQETPDEWKLHFRQKPWRMAAWVGLIPLAVLIVFWLQQAPVRAGPADFFLRAPAIGAGLVLLFVLHAATRRWALSVSDQSLVVRKGSWIVKRVDVLPAKATDHLFFKLLFSSGGNASHPRKNYYGLYARAVEGAKPVLLTTGLPETSGAEAVGAAIRQAQAHRAGRFTPGAVPDAARAGRRAGWGWLVWVVLMLSVYLGRVFWLGGL